MKNFGKFGDYVKIFILAVLIIVVYKTFDNLGYLVAALVSFLRILSPVFVAFLPDSILPTTGSLPFPL